MKKKTDKYTSPEIQNEILKIMSLSVLRQITSFLQSAKFLTIMVDETTDVSNKEQVVVCFRWVDNSLEAHEEFIGLHEVESTQASVLYSVVCDILRRLNLSISKLRGQCFDGASAMTGTRNGLVKLITDAEPRAVFTHCYGHALNLACSDAVKNSQIMKNSLDTCYEIIKLVKKSPRREAIFQNLKKDITDDSPGIRVLCPTRWTVRAKALESIISNYNTLHELWQESSLIVKDTEMKCRIQGVASAMHSFEFFFGPVLGQLLL